MMMMITTMIGTSVMKDMDKTTNVVFQCHHMSVMDFVVSLLVVAEV
jgi:hypothetical protein